MVQLDDLIAQDKDIKRRLLKARRQQILAKDNLLEYARYMHPHPDDVDDVDLSKYEIAPHHQLIGETLMDVEATPGASGIIDCPPRHGKSELASKLFTAWCMGRHPDWHIITGTYNQDFAGEFGRAVRHLVTSKRHQHVFPGFGLKKGSSSVDRLETVQGGVVTFVGRGGSTTGRGGHLLIIDDPLKDRSEADSPTIRRRLHEWFTQIIGTRMMTDEARVLIIQTRWHEDDLVGRIIDPHNPSYNEVEASKWTHVHLPALAEENDPLGRKVGEPLWPARFSTAFLARRRDQDPRGFSALYQGTPSPEDGAFFKNEDLVEYGSMKVFPKKARIYASSDHAVSQEQWADSSVFLIGAVDEKGDLWIHPDSRLEKMDTGTAVEAMLWLIKKHRPIFWWAERGHITKSIGPFLRKRMMEESVFCAINELVPVQDKQARAQSIKARMAMGKVHLPNWAPWYQEARRQMLQFPQGARDDFVDAMSLLGLGLSLQVSARTAERAPERAAKTGSLAWVKEKSRQEAKEKARSKAVEGW